MFTKTQWTVFLIIVLFLSACSQSTPTAAPTLASAASETPQPTPTTGTVVASTATVVFTPTSTPTQIATHVYPDSRVLGAYYTWTLQNHDDKTVVVPPNYRLKVEGVSSENQLTLVRLGTDADKTDAFAVAIDLFPNSTLYYAPLETTGTLPGTVVRGLPDGWSYFTIETGSWNHVNANADWMDPQFISLKGMILEAEEAGTQVDPIELDDTQFAAFMITCEKGETGYPDINPDKRSVFQFFLTPGSTFNFVEVCPGEMINGSGHTWTALRGENLAEKEEWVIEMANAYLELLYSRENLDGNPSEFLRIDNQLGGASNYARIWFGDQRYAPPTFGPPLAAWLATE